MSSHLARSVRPQRKRRVEVEGHGRVPCLCRTAGLAPNPAPQAAGDQCRSLRAPAPSPKSSAMTLRPILIHPDPRLKKVADPVSEITDEIRAPRRRHAGDDVRRAGHRPRRAAGGRVQAPARHGLREGGGRVAAPDGAASTPRSHGLRRRSTPTRKAACRSPSNTPTSTRPAEVEVAWTGLDGKRHEERFDRPLGDLRPARDRPPERHALHRLPHARCKRQLITRKMVKLKREKARA